MTNELKPCPFCGGEAEIERYGCTRFSTAYRCQDCGCSLETSETFNHGREWNTRAVPDMPELVRYSIEWCHSTDDEVREDTNGEYVLHSQTAEIIAADRATLEQAKKEINTLLLSYVREHFPENDRFEPLGDLLGEISQLDNAITITRDFKNRAEAAEAPWRNMNTAPVDGTIINVLARYPEAAAGYPRYAGFNADRGVWLEYSRHEPAVIIPWAWRPRLNWPSEESVK